jgi:phosphatidylinositol alpha-mannosyltransferase
LFFFQLLNEQREKKTMRIALVSEYYFPHLGGITEHVHNLAWQLNRSGHKAIIITSHMTGQGKDEPFVYRIGTSRLFFSNGSFSRFTTGSNLSRKVKKILIEEEIDVVHLHAPFAPTLTLLAQSEASQLRIPIVATFHSWFPRSSIIRILRRPLQRLMDKIAAKIAVSESVIRAFERYFTASWEIIPNGVNVGYFHPNGRQVTDAVTLGPKLLFLGRLDPRNGLNTLLQAMPEILISYPKAKLTVVGDGPLRRYYANQSKLLGQNIRFVGQIYQERPDYFGSSDLYLCPTTRASFGITLLEAMACGTPLVVSNIIGFRELVEDGEEAVLVAPNDPRAWAKEIIELIGNPSRRAAMQVAGMQKALKYAWPRVAAQVSAVYERVRQ